MIAHSDTPSVLTYREWMLEAMLEAVQVAAPTLATEELLPQLMAAGRV